MGIPYSYLSATTGFTVAARQAGIKHAIAATSVSSDDDANKVSGSRGLPPPAQDETVRLSAMLKTTPTDTPAPSTTAVELTTRRRILTRCAPTAMRMPTSCVRCVTAYQTTLYRPVAARASASTAKIEKSVAMKRPCPHPCVYNHQINVWSWLTTISGFSCLNRAFT